MPEPIYGSTTERMYRRLPEHRRIEDAKLDWPLKRYISLVADQMAEMEDLAMSWYQTGSLLDPDLAPHDALPWLAQLVGVRLSPYLSDAEKRDAIRYASAGWRAGTKGAVRDAARSALIGTKHCEVYDHSVSSPGDGGIWDVLLVTRTSETPDVAAVLATVVAKGAKPAGVVLHHRAYESSWDTLAAHYPTWNAIEAAGSWNVMQEVGL